MGSLAWKVLGTGGALLATVLARKVVATGWTVASGRPAPVDPANPEDVSWKEAVVFAVVSGIIVQGARVLAQRKAAEFYAKSAGHLPAAMEKKRAS